MESGHGGGTEESQGAVRAQPDILLFPPAQILMRLGNVLIRKASVFKAPLRISLPSHPPLPLFSFLPLFPLFLPLPTQTVITRGVVSYPALKIFNKSLITF